MRVFGIVAVGLSSVSAFIFQRKDDPEPWKCYFDEPTSYKGIVDTSNDGRKCMAWGEASENDQLKVSFGDLTKGASPEALDGNFCRAFSANDAKPWCFVLGFSDPAQAKQDCDVPQCPTDGPWAKDYNAEAVAAEVPCTDTDGIPQKSCDCSCAGAGGRSFIQFSAGRKFICHC